MHAIIELLPVILGFFIAIFYYFKKAGYVKNIVFVLLTFGSGFLANWLSKEGIELLFIDVAVAGFSAFGFVSLIKFFRRLSI